MFDMQDNSTEEKEIKNLVRPSYSRNLHAELNSTQAGSNIIPQALNLRPSFEAEAISFGSRLVQPGESVIIQTINSLSEEACNLMSEAKG
jgi:hypothetical protein